MRCSSSWLTSRLASYVFIGHLSCIYIALWSKNTGPSPKPSTSSQSPHHILRKHINALDTARAFRKRVSMMMCWIDWSDGPYNPWEHRACPLEIILALSQAMILWHKYIHNAKWIWSVSDVGRSWPFVIWIISPNLCSELNRARCDHSFIKFWSSASSACPCLLIYNALPARWHCDIQVKLGYFGFQFLVSSVDFAYRKQNYRARKKQTITYITHHGVDSDR